jgi:mannose-6-phosphate isomerase-like protein (cupin superfamily)
MVHEVVHDWGAALDRDLPELRRLRIAVLEMCLHAPGPPVPSWYASAMTYDIHTDVKYGPLEVVDAGKLADECEEPWWNQSLCTVNDSVARIGVFHGEFHWHEHDREDELFFVLEGTLLLDVLDGDDRRTVELGPRQGMVVPRGVLHRTRAPTRTVVLMVEPATVVPTGD